MLGSLGAPELLIIGAIVLLIFGVGRLSGLGKDLGSSIKEFRKAVRDDDKDGDKTTPAAAATQAQPPAQAQYTPPPTPPAQTPSGDKPQIF